MIREPSRNYLLELFEYRPDGSLIWKIRPKSHFSTVGAFKSWNSKWAGKVAGRLNSVSNYWQVGIDNKRYALHRIIYVHHFDRSPSIIDHIDGDTTNNRIENLREATCSQNQANTLKRKNNTSGYKGVSWNKSAGKWVAQIQVNNFKIGLGYFYNIEDAKEAYVKASEGYFKEFSRGD